MQPPSTQPRTDREQAKDLRQWVQVAHELHHEGGGPALSPIAQQVRHNCSQQLNHSSCPAAAAFQHSAEHS